MKRENPRVDHWKLSDCDGKGIAGCLFFILLLAIAGFVAVKLFPVYYTNKSLETDVRTEVSRAGAHFYDDEVLLSNILAIAKKNEVLLTRENVKVERFAGQINVAIHYTVPVDFVVYQRELEFDIRASSFIGKL